MGLFSLANLFGITLRESANDGSDFTNPDADYRRVFLGEDGALHAKDSAGTVTTLGGLADQGTITYLDATEAAAPSSPAAGKVRLYAKSDGLLYSKDDAGTETVVTGGGGGGGLSHAYVGYNTVGGTWETMTDKRVIMKSITLASAGLLTSVSAYVRAKANAASQSDIAQINPAVFTDNAGSPNLLIAAVRSGVRSGDFFLSDTAGAGDGRWFHLPVGIWLAAGTYWIGIQEQHAGNNLEIAKDGSGSDKYTVPGGEWMTDAGLNTITSTTDTYSIRGSVLS